MKILPPKSSTEKSRLRSRDTMTEGRYQMDAAQATETLQFLTFMLDREKFGITGAEKSIDTCIIVVEVSLNDEINLVEEAAHESALK